MFGAGKHRLITKRVRGPIGGFEFGAAEAENAGGDAGAENAGGVALAVDAFDLALVLGDEQRLDAAAGGDVRDVDQLFHPAEADKLVQDQQDIPFRLLRAFKAHGHAENDVCQQPENDCLGVHLVERHDHEEVGAALEQVFERACGGAEETAQFVRARPIECLLDRRLDRTALVLAGCEEGGGGCGRTGAECLRRTGPFRQRLFKAGGKQQVHDGDQVAIGFHAPGHDDLDHSCNHGFRHFGKVRAVSAFPVEQALRQ